MDESFNTDLGSSFLEGFTEDGVISSSSDSQNEPQTWDDHFMSGFNEGMPQEKREQAPKLDESQQFVKQLADEHSISVPEFIESFNREREQGELEELQESFNEFCYENGFTEQEGIEYLEYQQYLENAQMHERQQRTFAQLEDFENYFKSRNGYDFDANVHQIPDGVFEIMENHDVPLAMAHEIYDLSEEQLFNQHFIDGLMS